jgi:hypothetical protein
MAQGGAAIPAKSFNYLPPPTTADYSQEKFYAWKMVGVHFSSTYPKICFEKLCQMG